MPKIFRFDAEQVAKKNLAEPMDAVDWFRTQQPLLLWMANKSKDGRKLLRLEQTDIERVDAIGHNFVTQREFVRDGGSFFKPLYRRVNTTDFRVGAKWANLINFQWDWFSELAREYYAMMEQKNLQHVGRWAPVALFPQFQMGTTTTVYPDPDTESTSVDGRVQKSAIDTFDNVRNAADGSFAQDNDSTATMAFQTQIAGGFYNIQRDFFLFDTSGIADGDTVTAGAISFSGTGTASGDADNSSINIVASTPASNTAITTADYDQCGSTVFATLDTTSWVTTDNTYNDFTLDSNGIAAITKTGVSKFGGRNSLDVGNSAPLGLNRSSTYYADFTGTTSDPKLVVTHAGAGPANIKTYSGVAIASVKTVDGVALASVKTVNGIA